MFEDGAVVMICELFGDCKFDGIYDWVRLKLHLFILVMGSLYDR